MDEDLEATFDRAAEFAKTCIGSLSTDKILSLYGLYKQATEGVNRTPQPKFWNMTAKQKWEAWNSQGQKSQETAMSEYISIVEEINPNWLDEPTPSWVVHSTMQNNEDEIVESDKDVFYWAKENDAKNLQSAISAGVDVNSVDCDGLGLCHWAADRGHSSIMSLLLSLGADPNLQDADKQSALHYAASCGHAEVVSLLLKHGADPAMTDSDGNTPADVADSPEISQILNAV